MPPDKRELRELLIRLFSKEEMELFLQDYYPDVRDAVNFDKAENIVAGEIVNKLEARGHVDESMAAHLADERPGGRDEIATVFGTTDLLSREHQRTEAAHKGLATDSDASPGGSLQAVVDPRSGFLDLTASRSILENAEWRTALIEIGGRPAGTGFLVSDQHVLTNAHVVGALDRSATPRGAIVAAFDFGSAIRATHAESGRRVNASYVTHSPPTAQERAGDDADWNATADSLDYCVLELDEHIGAQPPGSQPVGSNVPPRGFFRLSTLAYDFSGAQTLYIPQHPTGQRIQFAQGGPPVEVNVNRTRVRYRANTLPGASGSPVIDDRGRLVALHHFGRAGSNQGIPIAAIARDLTTNPALAPLIVDD